MSQGDVINIIKEGVTTALLLAAPFLAVTMVIGLFVAIIQAATQIQEQSIAFICKIVAVGLLMILLGSWLMTTIVDYTTRVFQTINSSL
ncbi:MAG: flagellar biosynthetic protein FliQ [Clostridia bacterium]|nr:flagellar biosynthetic protein FliQ [Clostridia bacterium]